MDAGPERVAVFAPDCTDARVRKRMDSFSAQGWEVLGFSFRRMRYNRDYVPDWNNVELGVIGDRQYGSRLRSLAGSLRTVRGARGVLDGVRHLYAINLDLLALASYAKRYCAPDATLTYEVADIQPPFVRRGLSGVLLRTLERLFLRRVDLLVVTSPAFVHNYFVPVQRYGGNHFLLENKAHPRLPRCASLYGAGRKEPRTEHRDRPWVVAYYGAIRCAKSWDIIRKVAERLPDKVEFRFAGYPTRIDPSEFFRVVERTPNMTYLGEYMNPEDLPKIYDGVDFVWCFEFLDEEHNSRWLLPNRLYEGGYFNIPSLTASGFEVGRYVERLGAGWTFSEPYSDGLTDFFGKLTPSQYLSTVERVSAMPRERFFGNDQFAEMCSTLSKMQRGIAET